MNDSKLLEPDTYAVVDVLGHQTFAGKVSEHVIGGTAFIRVDVPELPEVRTETYRGENVSPRIPAFTRMHGLTATVIAEHFVRGWVKIRLDPNPITVELDWSIAIDRLEMLFRASELPYTLTNAD